MQTYARMEQWSGAKRRRLAKPRVFVTRIRFALLRFLGSLPHTSAIAILSIWFDAHIWRMLRD